MIIAKKWILNLLGNYPTQAMSTGTIARACNLTMRSTQIALRELIKEDLVIDYGNYYAIKPKSPKFKGNIEFNIEI